MAKKTQTAAFDLGSLLKQPVAAPQADTSNIVAEADLPHGTMRLHGTGVVTYRRSGAKHANAISDVQGWAAMLADIAEIKAFLQAHGQRAVEIRTARFAKK